MQRVAIIGGGMGGLALGYMLGQAGFRVTILEKGPVLSGLLAFTSIGGVPIERYYHHFFTHDRYLLDLLGELGLSGRVLWRPSRSAVYGADGLYSFGSTGDFLRLPWLTWPAKIRGGVGAAALRWTIPERLPADLTAEKFLRRTFGPAAWEVMWRPLLVNKFGSADAAKLSAQWIAQRIKIRTTSTRDGREVLGYINGSYRALADRLAEAIRRQGGRILLSAEVASLERSADQTFSILGRSYDLVVSTIAPDLVQRIEPKLIFPTVRYRAAICPLITLRSNPSPYYWVNILDPALPFSVIVNQQAWLPAGYYGGQWPLYIGHYVADDSDLLGRTDAELFEYYVGYLEKIWPGIRTEVVRYEIGRAKHTQPIMTAPWQPLPHDTNLPGVFATSMAHIFPEDRGVNYAIREARRLTDRLVRLYGTG